MGDPERTREQLAVVARLKARRAPETSSQERTRDAALSSLQEFERRGIELAKLDAIEGALVDALYRPRVLLDRGTVVEDPVTGEPWLEGGPDLRVVDRLLRLSLRRGQVQGSDAPRQREVAVVTDQMIEEAVARYEADIERFKQLIPDDSISQYDLKNESL